MKSLPDIAAAFLTVARFTAIAWAPVAGGLLAVAAAPVIGVPVVAAGIVGAAVFGAAGAVETLTLFSVVNENAKTRTEVVKDLVRHDIPNAVRIVRQKTPSMLGYIFNAKARDAYNKEGGAVRAADKKLRRLEKAARKAPDDKNTEEAVSVARKEYLDLYCHRRRFTEILKNTPKR